MTFPALQMSKNRWSQIVVKNQQREKEELEETLSNLENAEPELCIKLLHFPSVQNFSGFKKKIQTCSEEWMLVGDRKTDMCSVIRCQKDVSQLRLTGSTVQPRSCYGLLTYSAFDSRYFLLVFS